MLTLAALLSTPAAAADLSVPANRDSTVGVHSAQRGWSGYNYVLLGRRDNGHARRAILDFDLSSVPLSSDITGAELTVEVDQVAGSPVAFTVHAVTGTWLEGTEVPANDTGTTPNGVSWKKSQPGVNWTAGGVFDPTVIGSGTISATGTATFTLDAATVSNIRDNPATTHGLILQPIGAADGDLIRFHSREGVGAATLDLTLDGPLDNLDIVVAALADDINAVKPGFIDEASSKVRARPSEIVDSLRLAVNYLVADGCLTSSAIANLSSTSSGLYASGTVTGTHNTGAESGSVSGVIGVGPNVFAGTLSDAGGTGVDHSFGDFESGFNDLRLAADYTAGLDDGFLVGVGIRDKGSNGAFMAIHGLCDGPGFHGEALNDWVGVPIFGVAD